MTRRHSIVAGLLVSLLVAVQSPTVGAADPCGGYAREHCEAVQAAIEAESIQFTTAAPVLSSNPNGVAEEHFEQMQAAAAS